MSSRYSKEYLKSLAIKVLDDLAHNCITTQQRLATLCMMLRIKQEKALAEIKKLAEG